MQVQLFEQGIQVLLLERKFKYHGMHLLVYDITHMSFLPVHFLNTCWVWRYFLNMLIRQLKEQERDLLGNMISEIFVRWMQLMSTTIGGTSHHLRFSHAMKGLEVILNLLISSFQFSLVYIQNMSDINLDSVSTTQKKALKG